MLKEFTPKIIDRCNGKKNKFSSIFFESDVAKYTDTLCNTYPSNHLSLCFVSLSVSFVTFSFKLHSLAFKRTR